MKPVYPAARALPTYENLLLEMVEPNILKVTLNRPKAYNALSHDLVRELTELSQWLVDEYYNIRVVLLYGGDEGKGFCAGLDVKQGLTDYEQTQGNILITTGSKELDKYTRLTNYKERCYARVLSVLPSVMQSIELGFSGKHLIAMQGPFSREMNLALLHQTEAKYFVTKESGKNGGFAEKLEAAEQAGAVLLVIGRPIEEGLSVEEAEQEMRKWNRD